MAASSNGLMLRRRVGLAFIFNFIATSACTAVALMAVSYRNVLCCNVRADDSTEGRFAAAATTKTGYDKPERHNMLLLAGIESFAQAASAV